MQTLPVIILLCCFVGVAVHIWHITSSPKVRTLSQPMVTSPQRVQQPVVHVHVDTGAISQALLLGMKVLIDQQTQTLADVLREVAESKEVALVHEPVTLVAQANRASAEVVHCDPILVRRYRKNHTLAETAAYFSISTSTVKRYQKGGK